MLNLIYADKNLAIRNSFLYLNEVKENVYVYKILYGEQNSREEFSLRTRSEIMDPDSSRIVFLLPVEFNTTFPDEDLARKASEYYSKKYRFKIALKSFHVKEGDNIVEKWKLVNPNVKEPEI